MSDNEDDGLGSREAGAGGHILRLHSTEGAGRCEANCPSAVRHWRIHLIFLRENGGNARPGCRERSELVAGGAAEGPEAEDCDVQGERLKSDGRAVRW